MPFFPYILFMTVAYFVRNRFRKGKLAPLQVKQNIRIIACIILILIGLRMDLWWNIQYFSGSIWMFLAWPTTGGALAYTFYLFGQQALCKRREYYAKLNEKKKCKTCYGNRQVLLEYEETHQLFEGAELKHRIVACPKCKGRGYIMPNRDTNNQT